MRCVGCVVGCACAFLRTQCIIKSNTPARARRWLPEGHTCSFQLDLPAYTCLPAMVAKFRIALYEATTIDTDGDGHLSAAGLNDELDMGAGER